MMVILRRLACSISIANPRLIPLFCRYSSKSWPSFFDYVETCKQFTYTGNVETSVRNHSSPLFGQSENKLDSCNIKVIDSDAWSVSSCLVPVSDGTEDVPHSKLFGLEELDDRVTYNIKPGECDPDFDEVEDMRIHGNLFYKIERNSMEYEEYDFDYHGKKLKSKKNDMGANEKKENPRCNLTSNDQKALKGKGRHEDRINGNKHLVNQQRLAQTIKEKYVICDPEDRSCMGKKQRNPTFNQLTGPYHEPFCLDIFVSKGSVRACVIHRVTSKVVVVAHSISKDMKFDLGSTKSVKAAVSVGKVLAQRALEDDIHDVVYTPRKGDRLEGKLQVVLQSMIDNGINVKVKLKQRNQSKTSKKINN